MTDNQDRLKYLYYCFVNDSGTAEEISEFWDLYNSTPKDDPIRDAVFQLYNDPAEAPQGKSWQTAEGRLAKHISGRPGRTVIKPFRRRAVWAAAIIVLLGGGAYIWSQQHTEAPKAVAKNVRVLPADIGPGRDGAILTLADGTKVVLDSLGNGTVATQSGTELVLENGLLAYTPPAEKVREISYNTISTPKGRQFRLVLPDGTRVWLNAASSLRYPTSFSSAERSVQVTGEAYFDIVKDPQKPFKVEVDNQAAIEVLGTQFNVNAYEDEKSISTTLFDGSVMVRDGSKAAISVLLKPGQQARIAQTHGNAAGTPITLVNDADASQVIAWKNGLFNFQDKSLEEVMRQLVRWYDIDVIYEKGIPNITFWGKMDRGLSLNSVLSMLHGADVNFRIEEGRKLIVLP